MQKIRAMLCGSVLVLIIAGITMRLQAVNGGWTLLGWNNLGMHCMDSDYSVFSILPPYNTINAQLIDPTGKLVTSPQGATVTYQAIADPDGSINTTSDKKTNFWDRLQDLFGVTLPVDAGLAGRNMPGSGNEPQAMIFDAGAFQFTAEGIPITPFDDTGNKNYYPMMHLVAHDAAGNILATTDIVLPVSDEMDCRACHASDAADAARPAGGWVHHPDPERDYRLNILLRHDQNLLTYAGYQDILRTAGYAPQGLYATAAYNGRSILCARCHLSNALPGTGVAGLPPLTQAVHSLHGGVTDPTSGQLLDSSANRSACYRCHPGSETRCLRGSMGSAVAQDGSLAIQCQDCHGSMSAVGVAGRQGWLDEPKCQSCHTGTATQNRGQIRFTSAFDPQGNPRLPASNTFATNADTPAPGVSLYRFSSAHGRLQCEACHGSTHAEFPSLHAADNIQSLQAQGHVGTISDCISCHNIQPATTSGGPHGMHPIGAQWAGNHDSAVERGGASQCQACHGADFRGTVLSRALGDRTLSTRFGTKQFWRGFQIGCYVCHNGPGSEGASANHAPVVTDTSAGTAAAVPVNIALNATDADNNALVLRIVSQPAHGTVALNNRLATFIPNPDYAGTDRFTFAAWDGASDSNLGAVTLNIASRFFVPFYHADATSYTGFAVANFSGRSANVQFAAFDPSGRLLPFPNNPAAHSLPPQAQLAKLGSELFGVPLTTPQAGWVEVTGDAVDLGCIYQFGDLAGNQLDGAIAQTHAARQLRFTRVFEGPGAFRGQLARTFLSIANPNAGPISLNLNLQGLEPGQILAPQQSVTIPPKGILSGTVSQIFNRSLAISQGWVDVQVTAGDGAVGFEMVQFPDRQTVIGLNALTEGAVNQSYSAQLAITDRYFTNIKLINTSPIARTASLHALAENGTDLAPPVQVRLAIGQALEQDAGQLFGLTSAVGSLRIDADGPGILGDVIFGDPVALNFAASAPLQWRKFSQAAFNHVANAANFFTGIALLNPNQQTVSVTLDVYAESGTKTGSTASPIVLGPGQRISRLLTELVPATAGQMRGFVMLRATQPIVGQQLFGDSGMSFLSAVPPRIIN
jgi:hypothetical protein